MDPSPLEYARRRLTGFLEEANRLAESEFPYADSESALEQLRQLFNRKLQRLLQLGEGSNPSIVKRECSLALGSLFRYLPRLGFILRSTNVRNAFELYGPLLRIAREILEPTKPINQRKTGLLLSSEWDYSPYVFRDDPALPNFVLIGLPAPESANPLLIPMAGHELGHAVWSKNKLNPPFARELESAVISVLSEPIKWQEYQTSFPKAGVTPADLSSDRDLRKTWEIALVWALGQAEESFCDFLGIRLFGASFLYAFAYLLSPNHGHERSLFYPEMDERVGNHTRAANAFSVNIPPNYTALFKGDKAANLAPGTLFLLSVAEEALKRTVDSLITKADEIVRNTKLIGYSDEGARKASGRLCRLVPAEGCNSLADILNAAWLVYDNYPSSWDEIPQIRVDKARVLKELVLKSIEVFEIQTIQGGAT